MILTTAVLTFPLSKIGLGALYREIAMMYEGAQLENMVKSHSSTSRLAKTGMLLLCSNGQWTILDPLARLVSAVVKLQRSSAVTLYLNGSLDLEEKVARERPPLCAVQKDGST